MRLFPDLLPWEKDAILPIVNHLQLSKNVQQISLGAMRPRSALQKLSGEPVWVVAKNWQQAARWCRGYSAPTYLSVMSLTQESLPLPLLFLRHLKPKTPKSLHMITHSPLSHRFFLEMERIEENRLSFMHLPFPAAPPAPRKRTAEDPIVIGTLARFSTESNLHYFLNVAHYVARREPRARFRLLGTGPLQLHLQQMARDLGIEKIVEVVKGGGAAELSTLDAFLFLPLRNDTFLPLMLAGAAGVPVIANDIPGIAEFISDGRDGFLVPASETKPMAELVLRLIGDERIRESVGTGFAQKLRNEFSCERLLPQYEKLFFGANAANKSSSAAA